MNSVEMERDMIFSNAVFLNLFTSLRERNNKILTSQKDFDLQFD